MAAEDLESPALRFLDNPHSFLISIAFSFDMVPTIRQPAPNFCLNGAEGFDTITNVTLNKYKGQWLILLFYPMDWTFVCPTEIFAYNDAEEKLAAVNAKVVGISGDSPFTHLAWLRAPREEGGLGGDINIPLLSDVTREVMKAYGVYNEDKSGLDYAQAFRGLFLIDPKGILRHMYINDNGVGRNVDETIRVIKGLQFSDEHGEVCPANWHEGEKTFTPNSAGVANYLVNLKNLSVC